jgi:ASC-1-like (ASCH) protein
MKLWNDSFESIKKGIKTIEMRLNDEKRSKIKIGDIIEFTNISTLEKLKVKVDRIYKHDNFEQLYQHHDKISIGYKANEVADPNDMLMYYTKEEIEKYGVLGIKVVVI